MAAHGLNRKKMSISRNLVLIPLALITVYMLVSALFIDAYLNDLALKRHERNIANLARNGSNMLQILDKDATIGDYKHFADTFKGNGPYRISIIDPAGAVLGDSQLTTAEIRQEENQSARPEIVQAGTSRSGVSRRYSETMQGDLVYVAVPFSGPNHKGYFRVAFPASEMEYGHSRQHFILGIFSLVGLLIAVLLSILISRYLIRLVREGKQDIEQRLAESSGQIELTHNFITQLTVCESEEEVVKIVSMIASTLLPGYTGGLALARPSRDQLELAGSWNGVWPGETHYHPSECWALRTGKPHAGDIHTGTITCSHFACQDGKMVCIPLIAQGETHGVLHLCGPQEAQWTAREQKNAVAVAEHTSLTLANLRLRETLRQQAIRDPLTSLYNRRYLLETMDHEFSRALRHDHKVGLLMLDIDHFKTFNDEHGHDVGDYILSELGRLLKTVIRHEDLACRYGGEEFVVLITETDNEGTHQAAVKILTSVREHAFIFNNRSYGPITLSIGEAVYPDNGRTKTDLLKQADDALYEAKRDGRNRIVAAKHSGPFFAAEPEFQTVQ